MSDLPIPIDAAPAHLPAPAQKGPLMNPLLTEALASIIRSILKIGAGYLVAHGVWSQGDATIYVMAAALGLVGLGWSYWTTYAQRQKLLVALTVRPGTTEQEITQRVATGVGIPPVTTPVNVVPTAAVP